MTEAVAEFDLDSFKEIEAQSLEQFEDNRTRNSVKG